MSDDEIAKGSVGISETSHALLVSLVYDAEKPMEDRPFESIVEAFRFSFALGYAKNARKKRGKDVAGVAPRQFNVMDYASIVSEEAALNSESLGLVISEYAEAGCSYIQQSIDQGIPILGLIE